jgi:hypothetical protein
MSRFSEEEEKSISWGLTKTKFRYLRNRNSHRKYIKPDLLNY